MSDTMQDKATSARSPFAGCAIMIVALVVMVFLVVYSTSVLFKQSAEIERFTSAQPSPVRVDEVEGRDAALNALASKLESFRQKLMAGEEVDVRLSTEEINLAIAAYEPLKELRGTMRAESIQDGKLRLHIDFRLNGRPRLAREDENGMVASDPRFLHGVLVTVPELVQNEVILRVDRIEVPGATVPEGFIGLMSPYRIAERYIGEGELGQAMAALSHVRLEGDELVLGRTPGEQVAGQISDKQVDAGKSKLFTALGIMLVIFTVVAAVVLALGAKKRARNGDA